MGIIDLLLRPLARPRSTVGYPAAPADAVTTTRVPRFQPELCTDERQCVASCPTSAITVTAAANGARSWALDYGKCIFCAECIRACPRFAITGSGDFELAARARTGVIVEFHGGGSE